MKKILFFLIFNFSTSMSFAANNFTESEKSEILRQFAIFQKAVKNKDTKTLSNMIKLPLSQKYGLYKSDLSKDILMNNIDFYLNELTLLAVDQNNNTLIPYNKNIKYSFWEKADGKFLNKGEIVDNFSEQEPVPSNAFVVWFSAGDREHLNADYYYFKLEKKRLVLYEISYFSTF